MIEDSPDCSGFCRTCPAAGSCPDRVVCRCLDVTESELIAAIQTHKVVNLQELKVVTDAGNGCTCCHKELAVYLSVYADRKTPSGVNGTITHLGHPAMS